MLAWDSLYLSKHENISDSAAKKLFRLFFKKCQEFLICEQVFGGTFCADMIIV